MTLANNVTEDWAELFEVKGSWSVVYCRFCGAKWLNIGVCICLTGVCWMQVYFTANVGRKFRDSSCCPVNRGCLLNMGPLNIGFKYSELLAKLYYLPPSCEDPQILYIFCHHMWTVLCTKTLHVEPLYKLASLGTDKSDCCREPREAAVTERRRL